MAKNKLKGIQILRSVMFLCVFVSHCGILSLEWAVCVFFVMSGFLMTYNHLLDKHEISLQHSLQSAWHKISSLYPLHVFLTFAAVPYLIRTSASSFKKILVFASHLLLVQSWIPDTYFSQGLNSLSWFLSTILFFYFLSPYLCKQISKIRSSASCVLLMLAVLLLQGIGDCALGNSTLLEQNEMVSFVYRFPLLRAGDFICGMLLGSLFLKRKESDASKAAAPLTVIFLMIDILMNRHLNGTCCQWLLQSTSHIPAACGLVWIAASCRYSFDDVISKTLMSLSKISGEAYLIHELVLRYILSVWKAANGSTPPAAVLFSLGLFLTILFSIVYQKTASRRKNR